MNLKQLFAVLLIILVWVVRNRQECATPDCTGLCFSPDEFCLGCQTWLDTLPSYESTYETDHFWEERRAIERDYVERPW